MLAARIATALVGVPIILACIWFGGAILWILGAVAAGLAGWEAANLLGGAARQAASSPPRARKMGEVADPTPDPGSGTSDHARTLLAAGGASALALASAVGPPGILAVVGLVLIAALTLDLAGSSTRSIRGLDWSGVVAAALYAGLPLALLVSMRQWPGETPLDVAPLGGVSRGAAWLLLTLTVVWAVDSSAYAVGRLVGRHRLWPRVSPGKTWEGTIAGVVAGVAACEAWSSVLQTGSGMALGLGIALAVAAVIGDLAESALKRRAGVKDSGGFLPGHGGLLDRIDSLAFSAVVVFLGGILNGSAGTRLLF